MTNMTEVLDLFVHAVRRKGDFSDAKFVFAGKERDAECPLQTYIVACGVGEVKLSLDTSATESKKAQLRFDVYAKSGASKRDLAQFTHKLLSAAQDVGGSFYAESVRVTDAVSDANLCVWHQAVYVDIVHKREEVQIEPLCRVLVNGVEIPDVLEFEVTEKPQPYPVRELLSGVVGYSTETQCERQLMLSAKEECALLEGADFLLKEEVSGVSYTGCRLIKFYHKAEGTDSVYRYTLCFESRVIGEAV